MNQSVIGDEGVPEIKRFEIGHLPKKAKPSSVTFASRRSTRRKSGRDFKGAVHCRLLVRPKNRQAEWACQARFLLRPPRRVSRSQRWFFLAHQRAQETLMRVPTLSRLGFS